MKNVTFNYANGDIDEIEFISIDDAKDFILETWFDNDIDEMKSTQIDETHWGDKIDNYEWSIEIK